MNLDYIKRQNKKWFDSNYCLEAVRGNGVNLQYVQNQTDEICLRAVKEYGLALQFVHNQTDEICLEAVKENESALSYVHKQTPEIVYYALKNNVDPNLIKLDYTTFKKYLDKHPELQI